MSNMTAFKCLVQRAITKADICVSLLGSTPITTNVDVVLFADGEIKRLQARVAELEAKQNAQPSM